MIPIVRVRRSRRNTGGGTVLIAHTQDEDTVDGYWGTASRRENEVADVSIERTDLLRRAAEARERAYVPYGGFRVGCAALTDDGEVWEGANVECAAYPLSACAEATALRTMAVSGRRRPLVAIAIVGDSAQPCPPCGGCRQLIFEFGPDTTVFAGGGDGTVEVAHIIELLPSAFGPAQLA